MQVFQGRPQAFHVIDEAALTLFAMFLALAATIH